MQKKTLNCVISSSIKIKKKNCNQLIIIVIVLMKMKRKKTVKHFLRALNLHKGELRGCGEEKKSMKGAIIYCTF